MTQEQNKPVRSRDEQVQWICRFIRASGDHPSLEGFLRAHIRIAEARGAAEQRRKDAEWKPIETAPRDGTAFQARIPGNGDDNIIRWDCSIDHVDGDGCGTWAFASEQEPPDCWSDGWCWTVNEDGDQSVLPTHWKPLPDAAMDAEER